MNVDPLIVPTLLLAGLLFWLGMRAGVRPKAAVTWLVAIILAIPALLFDLYYTHRLDHAWYYQLRSIPFIELLGGGAGLGFGLIAAKARTGKGISPAFVAIIGLVFILVPYLKSLVTPLSPSSIKNRWKDGACLQTSEASCGPASAATLMTLSGVPVTERELVAESYTSRHGTENWYLARAIRRHGLIARYVETGPQPKTLPYPAIAGLGMGKSGHFVAVLGETPTSYIIADPLVGREVIDKNHLDDSFEFTGFFLIVKRPHAQ